MSFWEMMEDVRTGDVVPVIKVGVDSVANSACNQIVHGTTVSHGGVAVPDVEPVQPVHTVPIGKGK